MPLDQKGFLKTALPTKTDMPSAAAEHGLPHRQRFALPSDPASRHRWFCLLAGVLAERSIVELRVSDPRACRAWSVRARSTDLPGLLMNAEAGTTFTAETVSFQVGAEHVETASVEPLPSFDDPSS